MRFRKRVPVQCTCFSDPCSRYAFFQICRSFRDIRFLLIINFQGVSLAPLGPGFSRFRAFALHSSARASLASELSPLQSLTHDKRNRRRSMCSRIFERILTAAIVLPIHAVFFADFETAFKTVSFFKIACEKTRAS